MKTCCLGPWLPPHACMHSNTMDGCTSGPHHTGSDQTLKWYCITAPTKYFSAACGAVWTNLLVKHSSMSPSAQSAQQSHTRSCQDTFIKSHTLIVTFVFLAHEHICLPSLTTAAQLSWHALFPCGTEESVVCIACLGFDLCKTLTCTLSHMKQKCFKPSTE